MRVLVCSTSLQLMTKDAISLRKWTLLSASSSKELEEQSLQNVDAVLAPLTPPGGNLPAMAAELKKWKPVPSLLLAVFEDEQPAEGLEQYLSIVDRIIIVVTAPPKEESRGKIRYCRAPALGDAVIQEIESLQSRASSPDAVKTDVPVQPPSSAGATQEKPASARSVIPRDKKTLLERTCPWEHRGVAAVQAALNPSMKNTKLFIDTFTVNCSRPVIRCSSCNAANRSYARVCRYCGSQLNFHVLEDRLYQQIELEDHSMKFPVAIMDPLVNFGMSTIKTMISHKGFLWIGGSREDGAPLLVRSCTGDHSNKFSIPELVPNEVLGIEPAELDGRSVLVVTTRHAVYKMELHPRLRLGKQPLVESSPGHVFYHPAVVSGQTIVALEYSQRNGVFLKAGNMRKNLGERATPLVPVHPNCVLVCSSDRLWIYDSDLNDIKETSAGKMIEVEHPIFYDSQNQRAYVKSREGICRVHLDQKPWLDLRVSTSPNYSFCLSQNNEFLWVHDDNYLCRYSTSDFRRDFDSHSLHQELPCVGTPPVECGELLFVSTRWGQPRRPQVGILDSRLPHYYQGENSEEIFLPPQFNMGSVFLSVAERGRLCLKRYLV